MVSITSLFLPARVATAQFLRIGPFDLSAKANLDGIYTTNVEGERESESELEREDYYLVYGIGLSAVSELYPTTTLILDGGLSYEKHFERDDLDTESSNPFARLNLSADIRSGYSVFNLDAFAERRSETQEEEVFVGGNRKKRDVHDAVGYGAAWAWERSRLSLKLSYEFENDEHQDEEFKDGDKEEQILSFDSSWQFLPRASVDYSYERSKTEFLQNEASNVGWEDDHRILVKVEIWRRPSISYGFGYEKESEGGEPGDWEATHTLDTSDGWSIVRTPTFELSLQAAYTYEKDEEEDDIGFTYGAQATHKIGRTADQSLTATREPLKTFGSTAETDSTTISYVFNKTDLFIRNLSMSLGAQFGLDKPPGDGEDETTWDYFARLERRSAVTRKLERSLKYEYTLETSNIEPEDLDEHRVTMSFLYTF